MKIKKRLFGTEIYELPGQGLNIKHRSIGNDGQGKEAAHSSNIWELLRFQRFPKSGWFLL